MNKECKTDNYFNEVLEDIDFDELQRGDEWQRSRWVRDELGA